MDLELLAQDVEKALAGYALDAQVPDGGSTSSPGFVAAGEQEQEFEL